MARIARNYLRFWLGYLFKVRPALARGTLVVADRWAYGYMVQPHALKFFGPAWLARVAVTSLPAPDLVANLTAPPDVIRGRKQELTETQIEAELAAWATLPAPHIESFDTQGSPEAVASRILAAARS
jgi:thymidylate kinase